MAHRFWLAVERARVARGWTKDKLSEETAKFTADGKVISRSTTDNLRGSSRAPQARIVHALADALGMDREEAQVLAGLVPPRVSGRVGVEESILMSSDISDEQKETLIRVARALKAQHDAAQRDRPDIVEPDGGRRAV